MQCSALHRPPSSRLPRQRAVAAGLTRPLVAVLAVRLDDHRVLPLAEGLLLDLGVELVAPPAGGGSQGGEAGGWQGAAQAVKHAAWKTQPVMAVD
jgi:hypothetical protein